MRNLRLHAALRLLLALLCVAHMAPSLSAASQEVAELAYRRGDWELARETWAGALVQAGKDAPAEERARLCYNLGNVAYRTGELPQAVGWYSAALRLAPRDPDVRHNLELARSEAGLPPEDRGDLSSTIERVLGFLTLPESEWLLAGLLAFLATCLAGEALRGGVFWRRSAWIATGLLVLGSLPWAWSLSRAGGHPLMVVHPDGASARTHPDPAAETVETLQAGERVERVDEWPGWIEVRTGDGRERWVQEDRVFDLAR